MAMLLKSATLVSRVTSRSSAPKGLAQLHSATPTLFKVQDADFMHSDRLYKFAVKPPKKWKLQLFLFTFVTTALGTPAFVVWFSNKKAGIW
ncbi:hypothetical protein Gasu2_42530 [Galdieria sulphuraria]|uniref:Uncharacterized protein n=1 Tax=Galdieria sulphuraria TaxID=130081 RepID=M2VS71_GALSU|nr:uncharacterized protein Gasu_63790 [Galdieria sulphuraria]EME25961.1 hypothetical protein Gasu_63790 [Galdieria sulphuraria]GJD10033.1 hypothetical protein Gasu2_42530 [Galdieria sulphuraria]|eukprot:XP_005702481.1 hypothetical protein Gasu_63790 [Galdieria sulphuraria]